MTYTSILTELSEEILTITVNRPDKMNALNSSVINELSSAIDEVIKDQKIKAAIITGSGVKAFVAGADISEFPSMDASQGKALAETGQHLVFSKIENCSKPVIAAVNGFSLGGGCELAMACHFRTASPVAKFGQPEVNLGLVPGYGGTQRLTQLIGKGKAMELMMTGNMIDAEEAKALGLVNHIFPAEELLQKTKDIVKVIISKAPLAVSKIISLTNLAAIGSENGLSEEVKGFGELFSTADMKEGVTAFLEKRKAKFSGN